MLWFIWNSDLTDCCVCVCVCVCVYSVIHQLLYYGNILQAGKLGFYTEKQEWLVLLSKNVSLQQVKDDLADVNIYVDGEVLSGP